MSLRAGSLLLLTALALSACGAAPSAARSDRDRAVLAWRDVTNCFRAHGFDVPDPTIDDQGNASFPDSVSRTPDDVIAACQELVEKLPGQNASAGISAADLVRRRQFAQCMRDHGVTNWPDPDADGRFPDVPALIAEGKTPTMVAARDACQRILANGGSNGG